MFLIGVVIAFIGFVFLFAGEVTGSDGTLADREDLMNHRIGGGFLLIVGLAIMFWLMPK